MRPAFEWKVRSRSLKLGERTLIMGIVNVTPDSFSDGGDFFDTGRAVAHALTLLAEGADILDIGGESTRPGKKQPVSTDEEKRRVLPVIDGIRAQVRDAIISVDTYKAETAEEACDRGADIINDVSGLTWDDRMASLLASSDCGCVLMHTRGRPEEWSSLPALAVAEVVPLVSEGLRAIAQHAKDAGIAHERIVLDPGFGFGKRMEENFPLLGKLAELQRLGFPLLSGTSRKSFVARKPANASDGASRLAGSVAAMTASILAGAHIVRVHDVKEAVAAARVADAVLHVDSL
ncbi:MAG TPA: dihydropteroate synthase [Candidatus Sulfotelmatobacter sp.]|nr:dihydropteroate synthase [Candidatus Sulfotelmatobacter sp.]